MDLATRLTAPTLCRADLVRILSATDAAEIEAIRRAATDTLLTHCGPEVYLRGLIEFSNDCTCDCCYCGIRQGNRAVRRYRLSIEEILAAASWCAAQGYGSLVLQAGERRDAAFVAFVQEAVQAIKQRTCSATLPRGLGITLCLGQQTRETYQRWFTAGAHRYLLRIETSCPELFARLHPPEQRFADRLHCLRLLREIGYQVGTGILIGVPGQTLAMLADDILFFQAIDADMIGMGPYLPHRDTPLGQKDPTTTSADVAEKLRLSLLAIAATRLLLKDVNIAATTALQALFPRGREQGLAFGANIIMPQVTPLHVRRDYLLYEGKPCLDEAATQCHDCLEARIRTTGRPIGKDRWGDAKHALRRAEHGCERNPRKL